MIWDVTYILSSDVLSIWNGSPEAPMCRDPPRFAVCEIVVVPLVVQPIFQAAILTSGRSVAKLAVMMDSPISTVDQTAISRVDPERCQHQSTMTEALEGCVHKKSGSVNLGRYPNLTTTAALALKEVLANTNDCDFPLANVCQGVVLTNSPW